MSRQKGKRACKVVALVASLALVIGLVPAPAFALAGAGAASGLVAASSDVLTGGDLSAATTDDTLQATSEGEAAGDEGVSKDDLKELAQGLVKSAITADPADAAATVIAFGAGALLDEIFNCNMGAKEPTLVDVMTALEQLQDSIDSLARTVENQELNGILNDIHDVINVRSQTTYDTYDNLKSWDEKLAAGQCTADEAKEMRLHALTVSLGNKEWESTGEDNTFDAYSMELADAMTRTWRVNQGGKNKYLTLMQILYEHLRGTYHWEHQAYDEWADFQTRTVSLLMATLTLEKASLEARIQLIADWNDAHPNPSDKKNPGNPISRLKKIQDYINKVAGYEGKDAAGNPVKYPGLYSESTWNDSYWMYKQRDGKYRYYWVPGHEILFYSKVNTQDVPHEKKGVGCQGGGKGYWIENTRYGYLNHPRFSFWQPFVRYQGGDDLLASADQLKMIYKDYGSDTHLYDIFINKNEGNFKGLEEGNITTWWFVIDPDSSHSLEYKNCVFTADKLYCYVMKSKDASVERATLCKYHYNSNEPNNYRHYIGIGVAAVGLQTGNSNDAEDAEGKTQEIHTSTSTDGALWWPSSEDFAISYDDAELGAVEYATVDNIALYPSEYKVENGKIVIPQAYMEDLDIGEHELVIDAEKGSHAFRFQVKQAQAIDVKSAIFKSYGDAAFNLGAAAKDDADLSYESSNTKVATVGPDGKITLKGPGVAKVTVAAAETDDFAPASKVVTVKVSKGKNPIALAKKTVSVRYAKLKKAKKTVAGAKAKKAQGKVTYSITKAVKGAKSFKAKFSINKSTGKITLKKGLLKGTYKLTVKAQARGNANYKAGFKTAVVTAKVK